MGRAKALRAVLVLVSLTAVGCGDMWGDLFGSKHSAADLGANGCVKDPATIQAVMTAPPMCSLTSPCPCGTFCSSSSGPGNCLADCVDDSWCAPGHSCSPFGQCVATGSDPDGGTASTDPACPKDNTLLDTIAATPRSCSFTDVCPYGSSCNTQKGYCEAVCRTDASCQAMAAPGQTLVCGCEGKCVEPTVARAKPTSALPSIDVTPIGFNINKPVDITNANWGHTPSRVVSIALVSPFVNLGGANNTTTVGPNATVLANPGPGLMVQCPGATAASATPCSITFDPATFKKVGDNYRSADVHVIVSPSAGAHSVSSWTLKVDSTEIANGPQTVTLAYRAADPTVASTGATPLDPNAVPVTFFGTGTVTQTTPTGQKLRIPVKARAFQNGLNNNLVLFDETMQLSPSGKLFLTTPVDADNTTYGIQSLLRPAGPYDPSLQDSLEGGVLQWASGITLQQTNGSISGSFTTVVEAGSPSEIQSSIRNHGSFSTFQVEVPTQVSLDAAPATSIGACATDSDCISGQTCDFGLCSKTPPLQFAVGSLDSYDYLLPTSAGILRHKRMNTWGRIEQSSGFHGIAALYAPSSSPYYFPGNFFSIGGLLAPVPQISGEPVALEFDGVTRSGPLTVPLLTQHDDPTTPPPGVATNLRDCLSELQRVKDRFVDEGLFPPSVLDFPARCINMGRVDWALTDTEFFPGALRAWLEVHSFIEREGLEEDQANDATVAAVVEGSDANSSVPTTLPPVPLEQILNAGESGLGLVIDADMQVNAMYANGAPDGWSGDTRQLTTSCTADADCNAGGPRTSACTGASPGHQGACTILPLSELPQHPQPAGVIPALLDTTTSYLKVLEAYLGKIARQTYGNPNEGAPNASRQAALVRFGTGMRLALAAEATAMAIEAKDPCPGLPFTPNCPAILQRIATAQGELAAIRKRVMQQATNLLTGSNPFGIPEDDIPLFFGDPTGTNSRYFAASDYLIDGWAAPAVSSAQASLEAARQAWSAQFSAKAQDELNKHNRDQEVQTLLSKYGAPILANCGNMNVPDGNGGTRLLESAEVIPHFSDPATPFDRGSCYISRSDDCLGPTGGFDNPLALRNAMDEVYLDKFGNPASGDSIVDDVSNMTVSDSVATLTVRDEICKLSDMFWLDNGSLRPNNLFWAACPAEVDQGPNNQPLRAAKCVVEKKDDGNLYFHSDAVGMYVPIAALQGPIRKSDVGPQHFYAYANIPSDIAPTTLASTFESLGAIILPGPWVNGPDDNVYNYSDVRDDNRAETITFCGMGTTCSVSTATIAEKYIDAAQHCGGGELLPHDYPLPVAGNFKASCYLGSMGVLHEGMNTAKLRIKRAQQVLANTVDAFQAQSSLCKQKEFGDMQDVLLDDSLENMIEDYKETQAFWSGVSGFMNLVKAYYTDDASAGITGAKQVFSSYKTALTGTDKTIQDVQRQNDEAEREIARKEDIAGCWTEVRATKRTLDTALTDISIALSELDEKTTLMSSMIDANDLNLQEGKSVWQREKDSPIPSLSHEFWIDEKIERFKTEFEWSRRLTFLAMRAVEYEFQQTLPFRAPIVAATSPDQLENVVLALKQEQASRTINRRRPEDASLVVSLRDDVLGITDRSSEGGGERNWTAAERFASRLWDSSYAIRDSNGNWLGQGIPFTLGPTGILQTRCGERMWRATATIQGDGVEPSAPGAPVLLLKRNTFSSQYCEGKGPDSTTSGPTLQPGVIHPSAELFEPGSNVDLSDAAQFSAAMLYPWFNIRKADFYKSTYQDGASAELAGRGLYGDYVLLFPKEMLDDSFSLDKVEDVLLRIDYLSVDNLSQ